MTREANFQNRGVNGREMVVGGVMFAAALADAQTSPALAQATPVAGARPNVVFT
jgi:hypothetical protein